MTTFKNTTILLMLGMVCPFIALHAQTIDQIGVVWNKTYGTGTPNGGPYLTN
ncbi:hypothetical protein FACS1894181_18860 [Bacteroidia bacterium]|nr:hypothetical protein FACS1894181_18860 [Bacteroidia bacterium]